MRRRSRCGEGLSIGGACSLEEDELIVGRHSPEPYSPCSFQTSWTLLRSNKTRPAGTIIAAESTLHKISKLILSALFSNKTQLLKWWGERERERGCQKLVWCNKNSTLIMRHESRAKISDIFVQITSEFNMDCEFEFDYLWRLRKRTLSIIFKSPTLCIYLFLSEKK